MSGKGGYHGGGGGGSASSADRFNVNTSLSSNWDYLQQRFVGTGHPDISRHEWAANHHRDTFSTFLGHHDILAYSAVAENVSIGRARYTMIEKMLAPVGPPPKEANVVTEKR